MKRLARIMLVCFFLLIRCIPIVCPYLGTSTTTTLPSRKRWRPMFYLFTEEFGRFHCSTAYTHNKNHSRRSTTNYIGILKAHFSVLYSIISVQIKSIRDTSVLLYPIPVKLIAQDTLSDSERGTPSVKGQETAELERKCPVMVFTREARSVYRPKIN